MIHNLTILSIFLCSATVVIIHLYDFLSVHAAISEDMFAELTKDGLCYDFIPSSTKIVVFDTRLRVRNWSGVFVFVCWELHTKRSVITISSKSLTKGQVGRITGYNVKPDYNRYYKQATSV